MKRTKKQTLWYNPIEKSVANPLREDDMTRLAADREGMALLESYRRLYGKKL